MTPEAFRARLTLVLAEEEAPSPDWPAVERLCDELDSDLDGSGAEVPEIVTHFLSDWDIRARDPRYGDAQRETIRAYLATGEYDDGVEVPWWGCLAALVFVGGIVACALA